MTALSSQLKEVATAFARIPTAPYHEHQARTEVIRHLKGLPHLTLTLDRFGNLLAHYRHRPKRGQSLALVAHLDHPGFSIPSPLFHKQRCAEFLGGVALDYFAHQSVLFFNAKSPEPLGRCTLDHVDWSQPQKKAWFREPFPAGAEFGMWDLPVARFTRDRFTNRSCDDLVGIATMTALLIDLAESDTRGELYALYTRAEEVGFHGALASLKTSPALPKIPLLSLETSNARGFAKFGAGPILRVGDRTSIFTPSVTAWMHQSLEALKKAAPETIYQRLLMGGGTCEATVFQQAGYPAGALCVALENYHNMGRGNRIAAESVSLADWQGLYHFLRYLACDAEPYRAPGARPQLHQKLATMQAEALPKLKATR